MNTLRGDGLRSERFRRQLNEYHSYILSIDRTSKDHFWKMVEAFYKGGISV